MVEELRAVVAVKAKDREGDLFLDILDLTQDALRTFAPDRTVLGPTGENVGESETEYVVSGNGIAAVGNGIGLEVTGSGHIPVMGLDRNLVFEECSWLGRATPFLVDSPEWLEHAVDRGRTHVQEFLSGIWEQWRELHLVEREPER